MHVTFINNDLPNLYIGESIKCFMNFYREKFPNATVLPKMHFLEAHMVPWMKGWKTGFGMMGEQGSESIHARFNNIRSSYRNMPNAVDRLKRIVSEHYLQISPTNIVLQPKIKKRKLQFEE